MLNNTPITVAGQLVEDPVIRRTKTGKAVANIRVASTRTTYSPEKGREDRETLFISAVAWNQTAENIAESLQKGNRVLMTGILRQTEWQNKQGEKRTGWEVEIEEIGVSLAFATTHITKNTRTANNAAESDNDHSSFMPSNDQWSSGYGSETRPF